MLQKYNVANVNSVYNCSNGKRNYILFFILFLWAIIFSGLSYTAYTMIKDLKEVTIWLN